MQDINATESTTRTTAESTSDVKEHTIEKSKLQDALEKSKKAEGPASQAKDDHVDSDIPLPRDEKILIPLLESELDALKKYGESVRKTRDAYHGKIQQAAIEALAKCLGLRQKYFKIDDTLLHDSMYAALYKKATNEEFRKKRKNTTEYHLISRIYRGEERRQISSDALILQRANDAGQTEQTFAAWVLAEKGLDEIRRAISAERKSANSSNGKLKKKISKDEGTEKFRKLVNDLDHSGRIKHMTVLDKEEIHTLFGSWVIWEPENVVPMIVLPRSDGKFKIFKLDLNELRMTNKS